MLRLRFKNTTLEELLLEDARRLHEEAQGTLAGDERERLSRKARQTKHHLQEWLTSPGLKAPT